MEENEERKYASSYSARFDSLMRIKDRLSTWWAYTDEERKLIEGIIIKIDRYQDFLDEQ